MKDQRATATAKPRRKRKPQAVERNVTTVFYADYLGNRAIKTNRSSFPIRASARAFYMLRRNHYPEAILAEVFGDNGRLYAVLKKNREGKKIETVFEDLPKKDEV